MEAGKNAAKFILEIEKRVIAYLKERPVVKFDSCAIAKNLSLESKSELIFKLLNRLTYNNRNIHIESKFPHYRSLFYFQII